MATENKRQRQLQTNELEWTTVDPVLLDGEIAFSSDTRRFKVGPGQWSALPFWGEGVTDHGDLDGLGGDDHTQYHNDERGDARYLKLDTGGTVRGNVTLRAPSGSSAVPDLIFAQSDGVALGRVWADNGTLSLRGSVNDQKAVVDYTGSVDLPTGESLVTRARGDNRYIQDAPADGTQYARTNNTWTEVAAAGSSVTTGTTFPASPEAGDLHYFTAEPAGLYVWYDDGDSTQWVQTNGGSSFASGGSTTAGSTFPSNPDTNDLHFLTVDPSGLYQYYDDGNTVEWVQVSSVPPEPVVEPPQAAQIAAAVVSLTGAVLTEHWSFGFASITRTDTGDITWVFETAESDANYIVEATGTPTSPGGNGWTYYTRLYGTNFKTTTQFQTQSGYVSGTNSGNYNKNIDLDEVTVRVFRYEP